MSFNLQERANNANMVFVEHELEIRLAKLIKIKVDCQCNAEQNFGILSHIKESKLKKLFCNVVESIYQCIRTSNIDLYRDTLYEDSYMLEKDRSLVIYALYCLFCVNEKIHEIK